MAIVNSFIKAKIMHCRHSPKINKFTYTQNYTLLKASKEWASPCTFLSINRFNLFSFFYKKYGDKTGENPYFYAEKLLNDKCSEASWLNKIMVLSQPAILGWSFNPVSFWLYLDQEENIRAILCEVNNTFGESHKYFAFKDDFSSVPSNYKLKSEKVFYVSPFLTVEGDYYFRFKITNQSIGVWIDYVLDHEKVMTTSITGKMKTLTNFTLLKAFFASPFAMLKTPFLIHWQALKVWIKGVKYVKRNPHKNSEVTRCR